MKFAKIIWMGLVVFGVASLVLLSTQVSTSDAALRLTTTPLPTGVSGPFENQVIVVGEPLPHAELAPDAISTENISSLGVYEQVSNDYVFNIAFTRDGRLMGGFASETNRHQFTIWDVETLDVVVRMDVFGSSTYMIPTFSPDGNYLVIANYPTPGWIEVWSIETNSRVRQYQGGTEAIIGFSESGDEMWALRKRHHQIWDFADGSVIADESECLIACTQYNDVYSADWNLWAGMWSRDTMRVMDRDQNIVVEKVLPETFSGIGATFTISPNGRFVTINNFFDGDTYVLDLENPDMDYVISREFRSRPMDWTPDGSILMFYEITPEGTDLVFWDVAQQQEIRVVSGYQAFAQFSPDGRYLLVSSIDQTTAERAFIMLAVVDSEGDEPS